MNQRISSLVVLTNNIDERVGVTTFSTKPGANSDDKFSISIKEFQSNIEKKFEKISQRI